MSKCSVCNEEIRFMVMGMSGDTCWGCLSKDDKSDIVSVNLPTKIVTPKTNKTPHTSLLAK